MFDGEIIRTIRKVIPSAKRRILGSHMHFQMLEEIVVFMRCEWYQHSDCTRKRCVNQRIVASRYQIGFLKWEIRYFLYKLSLIIYKLYIHIQPFYLTVWKFHDFSITQILREINFGDSWSCKTAVFAIYGALNFVNLVCFTLQKMQKFIKTKIQSL